VSRWRERYAQSRLSGIERDLPRGAPPAKVDVARLVELTTQTKPKAATHWSTRTMATELGVSAASVSRHWRANGLKPHVVRGFKVSRDPQFVEKLEDIVGLYMSPPEHALVFCCDEKSQVQALDRTQPARVQQLRPQVSEFIRGRFKNCHYSKVSCSGNRGFVRFKAAKTSACSVLVVDSPALGWEPFRVMR